MRAPGRFRGVRVASLGGRADVAAPRSVVWGAFLLAAVGVGWYVAGLAAAHVGLVLSGYLFAAAGV